MNKYSLFYIIDKSDIPEELIRDGQHIHDTRFPQKVQDLESSLINSDTSMTVTTTYRE
jgi:hypothetical protein